MTNKNLLFVLAVISLPIWFLGLLIGFIMVPFYNGFVIGFTMLKNKQEEKTKQYAEEIVYEETEKLKELYRQELEDAN